MKRFSVLVTKVLMSTLTAGIFVFGFSSCTDDNDTLGGNGQQPIPPGAKTEMIEAYGLTFHNFIHDDDVTILNADAIARYYQKVSERYDAFLIEKSWQEVVAELRECPAYIENARLWRTYKMDINMDFLHRHFVSEMGREPAKTAADLEVLAYYVLTYSKLAYIYTPGYRSKFTGVVENLIKYGKSLGKYNDKQIEMAAYETLLEINMRYPATPFANLSWDSDSDDPRIPRLIQEYEYQLKRVKY